MAHDLSVLLRPLGVTTTAQLTRHVDRHTVSSWVSSGRLLRPYRGVVVLPDRWGSWPTRAVAAELATDGVLHSVSALTAWRLAPASFPVHVAVSSTRRAPTGRGLVVHRVRDLSSDRLGPHRVTTLPRSLCDAWALAHGATGSRRPVEVARAAVITALRDRRVRASELRLEAGRRPALPGHRQLLELVGLVEDGCQSELEIWGVLQVLRGPGMPRFVQQHEVRLPHAVVHLDAAFLAARVVVELDGASFHGSPEARERDTRRDVALAAAGWVVLRFSYRRLTREPEACRREVIAVCQHREAARPNASDDRVSVPAVDRVRCAWGDSTPEYVTYHDEEWGVPLRGDDALFERITLEAFQSGLSWLTILRKRPAFRAAFAGFDIGAVAEFTEEDRTRLLADAGIVRNRAKVDAAIANARAAQRLPEGLSALLWSFAPDGPRRRPATLAEVPATSPESVAMAKELKRRGFAFVGPTTAYALMQATGMVDDHVATCFRALT